jgi:hypothetical protein
MSDNCVNFNNVYFARIKLGISIVGFILNFVNIFIFIKIILHKKQNDNLFKYFLTKSLSDFYVNTFGMMMGLVDIYFKNQILQYIQFCLFRLIFDEYMCFVFQSISILCDVALSVNRYKSVTNRFKFSNKISIRLKIFIMFSYSIIFYSFKLFQKHCAISISTIPSSNKSNSTSTILYKIDHFKHFKQTSLDLGFSLTHTIIRDGICTILIIIFNFLILFEMRKLVKAKRSVIKNGSDRNEKANKAQKNLTRMVLITSTITFICHLLLFIYYLPLQITTDPCYKAIMLILFYLSLSINFFAYFSFNLHFKRLFLNYLIRLVPIGKRFIIIQNKVDTEKTLM